jgi:hypothetical protein
MAGMSVEEAHATLMSANPWSQYSGSVGLRNFAAAARATADYLRTHGNANRIESGDAGVMTQEQAERHAQWFEQVAGTATTTADKLDALVTTGYEHQTTAQTVYTSYQQAVARDSGPNPSGQDDMALIHNMQNSQRVLNGAVDDWSSAYAGFTPADPPPPPSSTGTGTGTGTAAATGDYGSTGTGRHSYADSVTGNDVRSGTLVTPGTVGTTRTVGDPGSVQVGTDGGDFAGWFRDPRTGYYVDPATGREFDPVTSRWVDPVTGKPFGDVTQYATGLQGLGGVSTSGGLLADTAATAGTGAAGFSGAGGFSGLFSGGNTAAVAGGYGGMVPPSLASGSAATGSLWAQGGRSLAVKAQVAESMLAREQAARAGRAYLPPTQAGMGGGAAGSAGSRGRNRPGYLTAEAEEGKLFSSRESRRAYLPPTQAGKDEKDKEQATDRPDWLIEDNVFSADPAPTGILGD